MRLDELGRGINGQLGGILSISFPFDGRSAEELTSKI